MKNQHITMIFTSKFNNHPQSSNPQQHNQFMLYIITKHI